MAAAQTRSTIGRLMVRRQLIALLEDEVNGEELLMKEVWETCDSDADEAVVKAALQEVIDWLRSWN